MIDPHAHLRDWDQADKETIRGGLQAARAAGLDAVFEMPNTSPPLTSRSAIERRLREAEVVARELGMVHGLYAGLTAEAEQIREVVATHAERYPRVVGLKLYAGHSTGRMGVVDIEDQARVYRILAESDYRGVLAVHAEKEALLGSWDPARPRSHAEARPPAAETESVRDQISLARRSGYRGVLHLAHVSVPETLEIVRRARVEGLPFRLTTGVTPHHALRCAEDMEGPEGYLLKVNPPLRPRVLQRELLAALLRGEIDWIETDHAPHTLADKKDAHASGIPVFPFYARFLRILLGRGVDPVTLDALTHGNIERAFGFPIPRGRAAPPPARAAYPFDPFATLDVVERPTVSLIAAVDEGLVIGSGGIMPWRHRADLRYFRETTLGSTLIMGRKTFQSLKGPLEGRSTIVLTRDAGFSAPPGAVVARTPAEALGRATGAEVFIAGGAQIYAAFLRRADRLYLTRIPGTHAGDTWFPEVDWRDWRKVWERPGEGCRFERYERRETPP